MPNIKMIFVKGPGNTLIPVSESLYPFYPTVPTPRIVYTPIPAQYPQPQYVTQFREPTPPPLTTRFQSPLMHLPKGETKHCEKRKSHAVPIVDPESHKDITEEILKGRNNNNVDSDDNNNIIGSTLRKSADEFVPAQKSPPCIPVPQKQNCVNGPEIQQQKDTEIKNVTIKKGLEEELSFITDENPSITAGIRQIPLNLEQQLNRHEQEEVKIIHSSVKENFIVNNPASHTSLPDSYPSNIPRKNFLAHNSQAQSLPSMRDTYYSQNFQHHQMFNHQKGLNFKQNENFNNNRPSFSRNENYNKSYNNKHYSNSNNRHKHKHHVENFTFNNYENLKQPEKYQTKYFMTHPQDQKIDQECTAHAVYDENQNFITSEADETKELKDLMMDMNNNEESMKDMNNNQENLKDMNNNEENMKDMNNNNVENVKDMNNNSNEVKTESIKLTRGDSKTESSIDNSQSSLNTSFRYSQKVLNELKKSPLVLTKPPTIANGLLDASLKGCVWRVLFDKNSRDDSYSNDLQNTSMSNNSLNGKKSNSRFDHGNHSKNNKYDQNNHNHHQGPIMRSKSGCDKHIIKISLKGDVKLNEAENAWKPGHLKSREDMSPEERELDVLRKNFRSLLNKLTEENFEHLIKEISDKQKYIINTPEKLAAIVELLFEKSISEPGYASTYAKLCQALSTVHLFEVQNVNKKSKTKNPWKLNLISRCQQEFERTKTDDETFKDLQKQIKEATDAETIESLEDVYFKLRQRANGTIKFIGELYKLDMLTANIMKSCIAGLITSVTEENIERLCKLFTTVGEKLERQIKDTNDMDIYMKNLDKLKNSSVITTQRIKFDIMNVIDLRAMNWKPRENSRMTETKPQKLQDLQEEEEKRKKKQQLQLNDFNEKQQNNRSFQQNMGRHNNNNNNNNNNYSNNGNNKGQRMCDSEGFRMTSARHFDINKVKIPMKNEASEVTLGPPRNLFQNFNKQMGQALPPTSVSNPFANLPTDCDDRETLPVIHNSRSGNKNGRKDHNNNHTNNNNSYGHNNFPRHAQNNYNHRDQNNYHAHNGYNHHGQNSYNHSTQNNYNHRQDQNNYNRQGQNSYNQHAQNNCNNNNKTSDSNHVIREVPSKTQLLTPEPIIAEEPLDEDDFFMIDLTDREDKDMKLLTEKMQQVFKGKITMEMLLTDIKKMNITNNILGCVYTDLFDKKTAERKELVEIVAEICKNGLISTGVNIEALKLSLKSIPSIICDVPHAKDYFSEYCVYFIENSLLKIENVEGVCQNQQDVLKIVKEQMEPMQMKDETVSNSTSECSVTNTEDSSVDMSNVSQNAIVKPKIERSLKALMDSIHFKLTKKLKDNFLDEIYTIIDKENSKDVLNFIKDLTQTLLKASYISDKKKSRKIDLVRVFPILVRYIDGDIPSQIECIDAMLEFVSKNPNIANCKLLNLFGLFYDNDVISIEAFKNWKKTGPISQKKQDAIKQTTSFFVKLEEPDLSDEDFNCTSSTIKE